MAIGIQTGVSPYQDFDDLFEPRQSGDPTVATTGVQAANGIDISQLYVPLSFGGSAIANNTGVQNSGGTDARNLFAARGSIVRWDGTLADLPSSDSYFNTSDPQNYALIEYGLMADGTGRFRYRNNKGASENFFGSWHGSIADDSNTEVKMELVSIDQDTGTGNTVAVQPTTYTAMTSLSIATIGLQTGTTQGDTIEATFRVYIRNTGDASSEISKLVTLRAQYGL